MGVAYSMYLNETNTYYERPSPRLMVTHHLPIEAVGHTQERPILKYCSNLLLPRMILRTCAFQQLSTFESEYAVAKKLYINIYTPLPKKAEMLLLK